MNNLSYLSGVHTIQTRFEVIRNGAVLCTLEPRDTASIVCVEDAAIKTCFSGTFFKPTREPVPDFMTDRLRPWLILDGAEHPCGEFIITSEEEEYQSGGLSFLSLEGYDLAYLVQRHTAEGRLSFPAGTSYISVIQGLLLECGIQRVSTCACDETLQTHREDWEPGTDYLTIINQLLTEINFQSLWADQNGVIQLRHLEQASSDKLHHIYRSGQNASVSANCRISNDRHGKYNVFTATVENPDLDSILIATSENYDPFCPFSTAHIGRVCAPIEQLNNISSQQELQAYVDNKKFNSMLSNEEIEFTTLPEPEHGVLDTVALDHERLQGLYTETGWTLYLGPELMEHKARKVLYL